MPERVDRVVIFAAYSWTEPNPDKPGEQLYFSARHGETINVTAKEATRGETLGGLADQSRIDERADRVAELEAELARLQADVATARQSQIPVLVAPPPPPPAGVVLTPSLTGIPQPDPLPTDVGPIAPKDAAAVAAARAAAGSPVVSVTPDGTRITADGPVAGPVAPTTAAPAAGAATGATVGDEQLAAMKAEELVAYLNQHSDDADIVDRVDELEATRARGPRTTVTSAIEAIRANAE